MKPSTVYLLAAEAVDAANDLPACVAISEIVNGSDAFVAGSWDVPQRRLYAKTFGFSSIVPSLEMSAIGTEERRQCRVLALLFMSEIAKAKP